MRTLLTAATLVAVWGLRHRRPWSRSPRRSTCTPRRAWPPSRASGGITTSRSSRSRARAPTASPTRPTTSSPGPTEADFDDSKWEVVAPETLKDRAFDRTGLLLLVPDQDHDPARSRGQGRLLPDDGRRLRRDLGRRQAAPDAGQGGRGHRRRLQRPQSRRAQGRPAGQGLPDRGLRHQRTDLGGSVQLDLPRRHVPRDRRQEVSDGIARTQRRLPPDGDSDRIMIDLRSRAAGSFPSEDPWSSSRADSELTALDRLGRDLPSLLQDKAFRAWARGIRIPPLPAGRAPAADPAAVLRPARVPGVGVRQPGRARARDACCRATSPCRSATSARGSTGRRSSATTATPSSTGSDSIRPGRSRWATSTRSRTSSTSTTSTGSSWCTSRSRPWPRRSWRRSTRPREAMAADDRRGR